MSDDLDALEAVAKAATTTDGLATYVLDFTYAETFDPPTVLALIERVRRADEALRNAAQHFHRANLVEDDDLDEAYLRMMAGVKVIRAALAEQDA